LELADWLNTSGSKCLAVFSHQSEPTLILKV
jgi:hypothetical protein